MMRCPGAIEYWKPISSSAAVRCTPTDRWKIGGPFFYLCMCSRGLPAGMGRRIFFSKPYLIRFIFVPVADTRVPRVRVRGTRAHGSAGRERDGSAGQTL
jgi:hypothetical protein